MGALNITTVNTWNNSKAHYRLEAYNANVIGILGTLERAFFGANGIAARNLSKLSRTGLRTMEDIEAPV